MIRPRVVLGVVLLGMLIGVPLGAWSCAGKPSASQRRAWDEELHRLAMEQDSLRARANALVQADPRMQELPEGDVVLVVPTGYLRSVIERVFEDVVGNVTLSLRGLKTHVAKSVREVIPIGQYVLDLDVHEVRAQLSPGQPELGFSGNRVSMQLPVSVRDGHGEATVHFVWDGTGVAEAACGDLQLTQKVSGTVVPAEYSVTGEVVLGSRGNQILCTPDFPEAEWRLRVKPSQASRDAVNAILAKQPGVCGWVFERVDVPALLSGVLEEQGFSVKIPMNKLPPLVLPAGVRDSVRVGGRVLVVDARTRTLRLDAEAIWYSADVTIRSR